MPKEMPASVKNSVNVIKRLKVQSHLTPTEQERLIHARIKVAMWALECERLPATSSNLSVVLGEAAPEVIRRMKTLSLAGEDKTRETVAVANDSDNPADEPDEKAG